MVKVDLMDRIQKRSKNSRNKFDVSCTRRFTAPVGALLPVYYRELSPGDNVQMSLSDLTRTLPMRKANFARISENYDVFFVPFRLILHGAQEMLAGTPRRTSDRPWEQPREVASVRCRELDAYIYGMYQAETKDKDDAGVDQYKSTMRLFHMLGYGSRGTNNGTWNTFQSDGQTYSSQATNNSEKNVYNSGNGTSNYYFSMMPVAAYQKIYQDYFRNKFWESENVGSYMLNNDYSSSGNTFDFEEFCQRGGCLLQYSNFDRDRNFGFMPDEGNIFSVGINPVLVTADTDTGETLGFTTVPDANKAVTVPTLLGMLAKAPDDTVTYQQLIDNFAYGSVDQIDDVAMRSAVSNLTALNLRRTEALQRFAEICALNKDDYKHQMQALFNVDIPNLNSDYCTYLGGMSNPVVLNDVEQTAPVDNQGGDSYVGDLGSRGTVFAKGASVNFTAKEHGYLMIIYHLQPRVDYVGTMPQSELLRFSRYDFAIPALSDLGFEPVRMCDLWDTTTGPNSSKQIINPYAVVGYLPRYFRYKTDVDKVFGDFTISGSANGWYSYVIAYDFNKYMERCGKSVTTSLSQMIDYRYFKVYPGIVDSLFYVDNDGTFLTDEFVSSLQINMVVTLPFSVDGLPY